MTQRTTPYLLSLLLFGLFLGALHPSITPGDSGEISAAAYSLGIAHPPGYPLYVIIAKLFTLALPIGNIAYRVSMVSAVFGALSCLMVYLITKNMVVVSLAPAREEQQRGVSLSLPALFASLSLAFSYELWYRSTAAEVYTLNTFLMLLIIYILLVWREKVGGLWPILNGREMLNTCHYDSRFLYLAFFLFGLGIGNHHTIVLVLPGATVFVLWSSLSSGGFGHLTSQVSRLALFFLLGLSVYLYLPVRSAQNPFMDWGDPQTLQNFSDVFTRKTYLPGEMGRTWGIFVKQIKSFNPINEFTPLGFIFILFGGWGAWRLDKRAGMMLLTAALLTSYGLIILAGSSKADTNLFRKFYLPSYAIISIFMGVGVATALKSGVGAYAQNVSRLTLLLAGITLFWQFTNHYPKAVNSTNYLAYDYGMNELNSLREGSTYISKGEIKTFPLWYLQGVERYREDVNVITAYFLTQRWYLKEALKSIGVPGEVPRDLTYKQLLVSSIYRNNADRGVYTGFIDEEYMPKGLLAYTQGITFQLYSRPEERIRLNVWPGYQMRGVKKIEDDIDMGIKEILTDYASSHYNTAIEYYEEGDTEKAIEAFEKALAINSDEPDSLNNLAALYAEKGIKLSEAGDMARKSFELYTGKKDKEMARDTIEGIEKKIKDLI